MCDKKVTQLPGTETKPKLADLVRQMMEDIPAQLEYQRVMAKLKRSYYKDCINEGFTKDEAFTLCRDIFNPK